MRFTPALFNHTEALLSELLRSSFPADLVVSRYFRQHRELGHAERCGASARYRRGALKT